MLRPKKVGTLPTGNGKDEVKQTNEIKFAPILLDTLDIDGKDITSDALHTQTEFSDYIVIKRNAHWSVEAYHYIIDWVYDEDRSTIRIGHGPVNITRLRRFAIGLIKSKGIKNVSKQTRALNRNVRAVLDYFKMTKNSQKACRA